MKGLYGNRILRTMKWKGECKVADGLLCFGASDMHKFSVDRALIC